RLDRRGQLFAPDHGALPAEHRYRVRPRAVQGLGEHGAGLDRRTGGHDHVVRDFAPAAHQGGTHPRACHHVLESQPCRTGSSDHRGIRLSRVRIGNLGGPARSRRVAEAHCRPAQRCDLDDREDARYSRAHHPSGRQDAEGYARGGADVYQGRDGEMGEGDRGGGDTDRVAALATCYLRRSICDAASETHYLRRVSHYWIVTPVAFTSSVKRLRSAVRNASSSLRPPGVISMPCVFNRSPNAGSRIPLTTSALALTSTASGVPLGTTMAYQPNVS